MELIVVNSRNNKDLIANDIQGLFNDNKEIYMLYNNGKFIGAYQLAEIPLGIEIISGVAKKERNKGYGTYILDLAYKQSCNLYEDKDAVLIILDKFNIPAFKTARKCGFDLDDSREYEASVFIKYIPSKTLAKIK